MDRAERICLLCGAQCCTGACPPVAGTTYRRLTAKGVPETAFGNGGYRHVRAQSDGTCSLLVNGKCSVHDAKPETCRAGPFTFDVRGDIIEIYLKYERICPMVRLLREVPEAYAEQYALARTSIAELVAHLDDDELAAICRIEEPDTEKVSEIPRRRAGA